MAVHITSRFNRALWLGFVVFAGLVLAFIGYVWTEKAVDQANELRVHSLELADELRRSSDALTRLVRSYVATGQVIYKQQYEEVLAIRDGQRPRPLDAESIYWDLPAADNARMRSVGEAVALLDLLQRTGLTAEEYALLEQSKTQSDVLARMERRAMALVEPPNPEGWRQRQQALDVLFGPEYQQDKLAIMKPLAEFGRLLEQRTRAQVDARINAAFQLRLLVIALCCLQVYMLWRTYSLLQKTLGGSVEQVHGIIQRMGSGDFSLVHAAPQSSVIGWLAEMQSRLRAADTRRSETEAELSKNAQALEQANRELQNLSHLDALTTLQNRRSADETLRTEFTRFKRTGRIYSVLFIDIDHFKRVNDSFGHEVGDKVLRELATVVLGGLRQTDFVARYGGEEFIVLLPDTGLDGALTMAEKLRVAVEQHSFPVAQHITISLGLSQTLFEDSHENEAVRRADVALYRAKSDGRNRVCS